MESKRSKSDKKHGKELKSFKNRLGKNLIWFNSLSVEKQYDLLFIWKKEKWRNKNGLRPKLIVKYNHITRKREKVPNPELKLKHTGLSLGDIQDNLLHLRVRFAIQQLILF